MKTLIVTFMFLVNYLGTLQKPYFAVTVEIVSASTMTY